uniref:Uncharacterized protein n=1 Tax=Acrobeloides nanus TaxID=290746 RepID=A0A914DLM0_9BILA
MAVWLSIVLWIIVIFECSILGFAVYRHKNQGYYKPAPNRPTFVEFLNGIDRAHLLKAEINQNEGASRDSVRYKETLNVKTGGNV